MERRQFLKKFGGGLALAGLSPFAAPAMTLAQSPGCGKILVNIDLGGGADGMFMFPFIDSSVTGVINSVRGVLAVNQNIHPVTNRIGFHQNWAPLVSELNGRDFKLITCTGISNSDDRSHAVASKEMDLLTTNTSGSRSGWIGRLKEAGKPSGCYGKFSVWGLRSAGLVFEPAGQYPAVKVRELKEFDYKAGSFQWTNLQNLESSWQAEFQNILAAEQALLQIPITGGGPEQRVHEAAAALDPAVRVVRTMRNINLVGTYLDDSSINANMRDAARICIDNKINRPGTDTVIKIDMGGYDSHSYQIGWLTGNMQELSQALAGFVRDMKAQGLWSNTVIAVTSEFGRTIKANKPTDAANCGTEHGRGNTLLVLGGGLNPGSGLHIGDIPTADYFNQASGSGYTAETLALPVEIDIRNLFGEIVSWLGYNPADVILDGNYVRRTLGLFA